MESSITLDAPQVSGRESLTWFRAVLTLTMVESMLVPSANSSRTMLTFSRLELVTLVTPVTVPRADSNGLVTSVSTFSGLAPGSVVMTIMYGRSISGSRSVVILVRLTALRVSTMITATRTVKGFFTQNFDIVLFGFLQNVWGGWRYGFFKTCRICSSSFCSRCRI